MDEVVVSEERGLRVVVAVRKMKDGKRWFYDEVFWAVFALMGSGLKVDMMTIQMNGFPSM